MNRDGNRRVENGRLIYYNKNFDEHDWESLWKTTMTPNYYAPYQKGFLWLFEKVFTQHLPTDGLILEAGCGTSQWLIALRARGYQCLGVDYAVPTLLRTNQLCPVPVLGGDLLQLGLASESVSAIISLGVVEHRQAGPEIYFQELSRVLKPGGKLLISVPYFHPLRRWRAAHGAYQDDVTGLGFYQQAFTREDFGQIVSNQGFEIIDWVSYEHHMGLRQELSWLKKIGNFPSRVLYKISDYIPYLRQNFGHMLMLVGRKK
jgi:SAM-dependent methyltransferase